MKTKAPTPASGSHTYAVLKFGVRKQDVRKASILQAVIEILAKQGVDELSFDKVGRAAKMARSHVVYYFPTRESMIEAALRYVAFAAQENIVRHMPDTGQWEDLLTGYIEGCFRWVKDHPDHATLFFLMYYQGAVKTGYSREIHSAARDHGAKRIAHILKLAAPWDPKALQKTSKGIQALITGNILDALSTDRSRELNARQKETTDLALQLVRGFSGGVA